MSTMRAADPLSLSEEQRAELEQVARSTSSPHWVVLQARALLDAAEGTANYEIARRVGVSANSIRAWRARCTKEGIACLQGMPATQDQVDLCNIALTEGSTPAVGQAIAVASILAAANTCE